MNFSVSFRKVRACQHVETNCHPFGETDFHCEKPAYRNTKYCKEHWEALKQEKQDNEIIKLHGRRERFYCKLGDAIVKEYLRQQENGGINLTMTGLIRNVVDMDWNDFRDEVLVCKKLSSL
jgi:hypothetical protein